MIAELWYVLPEDRIISLEQILSKTLLNEYTTMFTVVETIDDHFVQLTFIYFFPSVHLLLQFRVFVSWRKLHQRNPTRISKSAFFELFGIV